MRALAFPILALGALLWTGAQDAAQEPGRVLHAGMAHLGNDATPEWPEAAAQPDHSHLLTVGFEATADDGERALEIRTRHVDGDWAIAVNGTEVGRLIRGADLQTKVYPLPGGLLLDGANELTIQIGRVGDDITVGEIRLLDRSFRAIHDIRPLRVQVRDLDGAPLQARLTVVRADGSRAPLYYGQQSTTPVRDGFAYTDANGAATLEIVAGEVRIWASRGMEWGIAEAAVTVGGGDNSVELQFGRELDTPGFVSIDTHLHTFTFSGHGDASLDERLMTLAGEGLDIAVATDHNHQTDYAPRQAELGLDDAYLTIVGNEVSTPVGHFNAFPMSAGGPLPVHDSEDWHGLARGMREAGAQVVILNHPRWPDFDRGPFGKNSLDPSTGVFANGLQLPVDAIELFNSTVVETPWRSVLTDWFGLLNHGTLVRGVGTSDSHTVIDPAGQGRTYVACANEKPSDADVDAICAEMRRGNSTMSQGLYLEVEVAGLGPGSLAPAPETAIDVVIRAACASWASVERLEVWVDGELLQEFTEIPPSNGKPTDFAIPLPVNLPAHDCWVVVVAEGPKPEGAWWYTLQHELSAVSNPIFLDRDGDGRWSSPKRTAELLLETFDGDPAGLMEAAAKHDAAVRSQLDLLLQIHKSAGPTSDQR